MVFEVSATAAETQSRVEALVNQITATLLSGTDIASYDVTQLGCVLCCVKIVMCCFL